MSLRDIKIKTGVVKRLHKEHGSYFKEADMQRARIERLKSEGVDPYDIKKQHEVLEDSLKMIPDAWRRYEQNRAQLEGMLGDPEHAGCEEEKAAVALLKELDDAPRADGFASDE